MFVPQKAQSWVLQRLLQGMVDGDVTVEDWLRDDISLFIRANPMAVFNPRNGTAAPAQAPQKRHEPDSDDEDDCP